MYRDRAKGTSLAQPQKTELGLAEPCSVRQYGLEHGLKLARRTLMTCRTSKLAVCCSSASERCPCASASSRVRASSCFFNSISELGPSLTCALAFVPVERG